MSARLRTWITVIGLLLVAAAPRVWELGELGFYADEETTAMASSSILEVGSPHMPSGMPYRRALPLSWLNAVSAKALGTDRELPYRIPAALFGIATVPLLFLLSRRYVGHAAALVATVMLALSEWHIAFSRNARMYAPLLLFVVVASFITWRWAETGRRRYLIGAVASIAAGVAFHRFGTFALPFALLPMLLGSPTRIRPMHALLFVIVCGLAAEYYFNFWVSAPYADWIDAPVVSDSTASTSASWLPALLVGSVPPFAWPLALLGAAVAVWGAIRIHEEPTPTAPALSSGVRLGLAAGAGAFVGVGQLYAAALTGLVFMLLSRAPRRQMLVRTRAQVALLALGGIAWLAAQAAQHGLGRGLRLVSRFPFPYPAFLAEQFPLVLAVFALATLWVALRSPRSGDVPIRIFSTVVLIQLAAVGAVSEWGGTRYLMTAYPMVLLVAATGLLEAARRIPLVGTRTFAGGAIATPVVVALVATGALGGHGIPQALRAASLSYGEPIDEATHMVPFRPDHKGAGEFVRSQLRNEDVVIAEDALEQRWYAGRVDYWLRSYDDAVDFLYRADTGELRDIYVSSTLLPSDEALTLAASAATGHVWLITSGETYYARSYFLSDSQRRWLDSLENERAPAFVGRDGITRVYCVNCP